MARKSVLSLFPSHPSPNSTRSSDADALFKLADAIERRVAVAMARAEKLTQAILAKAFRGELVPTEAELARREGRDYEPASVVLERIRAGRAVGEPSPRPSPRGRGRRERPPRTRSSRAGSTG